MTHQGEIIIAEAIRLLANEIKFLGNGNADRSVGHGAIEGLAMLISESNNRIADSLNDVAEAIRELAQAMSEK